MMYGYGFRPNNRLFSGGGGTSPLWDGLLAYYTADNTPNDATGNGYNGTLVNGATYGTGIINQGFSFDGVNDYIDFGNVLDFDGSTDFTFNFWVNLSSVTNEMLFWKMNALLTTPGYILYVLNGKIEFAFQNSTSNRFYCKTVDSISAGFSMISVIYDSSLRQATISVNGVNKTLTVVSNTFTLSSSNSESLFFGKTVSSVQPFDGVMDECGVFGRKTTPTEVTELYNSSAGLQYTP